MGLLDSLLRHDGPDGDPQDAREAGETTDPAAYDVITDGAHQTLTSRAAEQILVGSPSAGYLPPHAARALLRHLREAWGLPDPRVSLMLAPRMRPSRSLVIGRRLSGFADPAHAAAECRRLLWYLPPGRAIVLMPETWTLAEMTPLTSLCGGAPA